MARPRLMCEVVDVQLHLRLRRGEDDDLIQFFEHVPPRQRNLALKIALRAGGLTASVGDELSTEQDEIEALAEFVF